MNIYRKSLQTRRLAQNNFHWAHGFFTCFNIFGSCSIISAFYVIIFNFLYFFLIKQHFCNAGMILNWYSKAVSNSLIHGITINFITEGLICFWNRCTRKANKCRIRKRLSQHLGIWLGHHSLHIIVGILTKLYLFRIFKLRSMRLIRKADNVWTLVYNTDFVIFPVTEFLNGANVKSAAFTGTKFLTKLLSVGNNTNFAKI